MKVVLAQINPTVGDILGNYKKIVSRIDKFSKKADLIVFPELSISGYPPEDLVLKQGFLSEISDYLERLKKYSSTKKVAIILGAPIQQKGRVYNAGIFLFQNKIL